MHAIKLTQGSSIEPRWGSESERVATQGGAALALGSVIEPRWGSGTKAFLKTEKLHNKRLHADARALSDIVQSAVSRLRWAARVGWAGAGDPHPFGGRTKRPGDTKPS